MISNKVTTGTLSGLALLLITWALTTFIPAWHSALPAPVATVLPGVIAAAGYFSGGWTARHQATVSEIERAAADADAITAAITRMGHPVTAAPAGSSVRTPEPPPGP